MRQFYVAVLLSMASLFLHHDITAQYTNKGKDFWVGYQRTNGFSTGNGQQMVIYMATGSQAANVQIEIEGNFVTPWIRNYVIPANSAMQSDFIPKTGDNNATLPIAGYYSNRGIHITSDVPIVAYAHIYESTNSGATMLMPTNVWGYEYYTVNNRQFYPPPGTGVHSSTVFHVIAKEDSTWIEINPSKNTNHGWVPNGGTQPNGSYLVKLDKGDVYQVLGGVLAGNEGLDLTGSSVKSIPNGQGITHPIAVFSGSTRTGIGCGTNTGGTSGDLIIQQVFPYELWGTKYLTAPFSTTVVNSLMTCIYRVMVKDITTIVKRNGVIIPSSSLIAGTFYQFESNTADVITSDKPILVAQYMASNNACPNTGNYGDPEMIFLTPLTGAIPQTNFYRNSAQAINVTYVTLVVPNPGMSTLKVDGVLFNNITATDKYAYPHPNMPGYTVATKRFAAGSGQSSVESNYAFTGYTYGIGSVESYAYNLGIQIDSANLQSVKYNTIRCDAFMDHNQNGTKEASEPLYPYLKLQTIRPGIDTFNSYTYSGRFAIAVDSGTYVTSAKPFSPYYMGVPASATSYFANYFEEDTLLFAIQPILQVRDLSVTMIPVGAARPGFTALYRIVYLNKGTDTADAVISLAKKNNLEYVSSSVATASVTADTIKWNLPALFAGTGGYIDVIMKLPAPPVFNNGDTLRYKAIISSEKPDSTSIDNVFPLVQRVTGSYDPNDKMESHGGQVRKSSLTNGERLHYTIRFQNTGTDTAFNVVIRDTLHSKLDWNTLTMTGASHNYHLVVNDGHCAWSFNNINLVDSNKNEPLSHGFLSFSIEPLASANPGDVITNKASIYFDHNLPIVTNIASTSIIQEVLPVSLLHFIATKKPEHNLLEWRTAQFVNFSHFEIERSGNGQDFQLIGKQVAAGDDYRFMDYQFAKGVNYYRLKMVDKDNKFVYSPVRRINNGDGLDITLYPNPATDVVQLRIETPAAKTLGLQLMSAEGRTVQVQQLKAGAGLTITPLAIGTLKPGLYFIRIDAQGETPIVLKFEKK